MHDQNELKLTEEEIACGIPMIVIYDHPRDFPGVAYVARVWEGIKPGRVYMTSDSVWRIRNAIRRYTGLCKMPRMIGEDPCIKEVWL